jgi:hypothetical protein
VALVIRGLFICEFTYLRFAKIYQNSVFSIRLFTILMKLGTKFDKKRSFLAIQCSLAIRGFNIRGILAERIYRELRGPPVYFK